MWLCWRGRGSGHRKRHRRSIDAVTATSVGHRCRSLPQDRRHVASSRAADVVERAAQPADGLFRMMAERGDFTVPHEPFSYLAEFGYADVAGERVTSAAGLIGALSALGCRRRVFAKETTGRRYPEVLAEPQFLGARGTPSSSGTRGRPSPPATPSTPAPGWTRPASSRSTRSSARSPAWLAGPPSSSTPTTSSPDRPRSFRRGARGSVSSSGPPP